MKSMVLALALVAPMTSPAVAQDADGMSCRAFIALGPSAQMQTLSTLQPFGDDMEPDDVAASEQWTATVAAACAEHPDRMLADAARDAMGD